MTAQANVNSSSIKIGELLVKEGLVSKKDIEKALEIQKKETEDARLPLGMLLVKKGLISRDQNQSIMAHPELRKNIGAIALENGLITAGQLAECLKKRQPHEQIGEVMIKEGYITADDLQRFLQKQLGGMKLGQLALKLNMINEADLESALRSKHAQRTLGAILCDMDLITPVDLNRILIKYNKKLKLGDVLLKQKLIEPAKLKVALQEQLQTGDPLGSILLRKQFISHDQLYAALSKQYNIPFDPLGGFVFDEAQKNRLVNIIESDYARENQVLPLSLDADCLKLALCNPEKIGVIRNLRSVYANFRVNSVLIAEEKFSTLFEVLYGERFNALEQQEPNLELGNDAGTDINDPRGRGGTDQKALEIVDFIIQYGVVHGASDIHIEQDRGGTRLRYRFDGVLQTLKVKWLESALQPITGAVIGKIKQMANLNAAETHLPQDGMFRFAGINEETKQKIDLECRVASCPAIGGENVTIRILDSVKAKVDLNDLDLSAHVLGPFKTLLKSVSGMLLIAGPAGSGKLHTLYGALHHIYHPGIKIITAEDPIAYSFQGIMQTQINPEIDLSFARLLRSILRLDANIIMVAELRDADTARLALDAAQQGHLVLSSLSASDAVSAIFRLVDYGLEPNQIASSLLGVLAQRSVRRICSSCRQAYTPEKDLWQQLFDDYPDHITFFRGQGCAACYDSGYQGQSLISEMLTVDRRLAQAMNRGAGEAEIKQLASQSGMRTMIDDGLMKLDQVPLPEIIQTLPYAMIKEFRDRIVETDVLSSPPAPADMQQETITTRLADEKWVISDPEKDRQLIDELYARYEALMTAGSPRSSLSDLPLFREFIVASYKEACGKFNCSRVVFSIGEGPGGAEICAAPCDTAGIV